jgi:hypothetical protein
MYSIHVVGDRMGGCDGDGARLSVRKKLGIDIAFAHSSMFLYASSESIIMKMVLFYAGRALVAPDACRLERQCSRSSPIMPKK